ncbi:MAG: alpha/beta hydrolase [Pseudomonadota bacterium]|nr:alpha/beta hydrolase [Pseudomonadota bacterium]MDE3037556.1 alpha/beta hydrolase [Pseudomonadota bacterium]
MKRFCLLLTLLVLTVFPNWQLLADSGHDDKTILEKITVSGPHGEHVDKANIFIGDKDEGATHAIRNSASFTKDTYGDNYYADYNQQKDIEAQIAQLPKSTPVNLIGHGLGGATAAKIAVDMAHTRRIDILMTIAPSGDHPDFTTIKNSVNQWVNVNAEGR